MTPPLNADQTALENAVNQGIANLASLPAQLDSMVTGVSGTISQMNTTAAALGAAGCGILQADVAALSAALSPILTALQAQVTALAAISSEQLENDLNSSDQFGRVT